MIYVGQFLLYLPLPCTTSY